MHHVTSKTIQPEQRKKSGVCYSNLL